MAMIEVKVSSANAGQKAEKFVKKYLSEAPLGFIYKAFRKKDIKANGHWVKKDHILQEGDVVRIYVTDAQLEDFKKPRAVEKKPFPYKIAYEDDQILIVDKNMAEKLSPQVAVAVKISGITLHIFMVDTSILNLV